MSDQQMQREISPEMRQWLGYMGLALAAFGFVLQFPRVNLLTGDAIYWIGAALAVAGTVGCWLTGEMKLKIAALILAALCVANVYSTEQKFNTQRHQLQQIVTNVQTSVTPPS